MLMSQPHSETCKWKLLSLQTSIYCVFYLLWKVFLLISLSLHLIKHCWSFSYHWHVHFMSTIKLKLKQDSWFCPHLGHCSLEGNLQAPCLASAPGVCLLSTPNNYFPTFHSLWVSSIWLVSRITQLPPPRIPTRKWRWNSLPRHPWGKDQWRRHYPPTHPDHLLLFD